MNRRMILFLVVYCGGCGNSQINAEPQKDPHQRQAEAPTPEDDIKSLFKQFDTESVDANWSGVTTQQFRRDLERHAEEMHARVLDVQCKSSVCKADVEFDDAVQGKRAGLLAARDYEPKCEKLVTTPRVSPGAESQPYRVELFLRCGPGLDR